MRYYADEHHEEVKKLHLAHIEAWLEILRRGLEILNQAEDAEAIHNMDAWLEAELKKANRDFEFALQKYIALNIKSTDTSVSELLGLMIGAMKRREI
jgi:predicted metalloendopeptidase